MRRILYPSGNRRVHSHSHENFSGCLIFHHSTNTTEAREGARYSARACPEPAGGIWLRKYGTCQIPAHFVRDRRRLVRIILAMFFSNPLLDLGFSLAMGTCPGIRLREGRQSEEFIIIDYGYSCDLQADKFCSGTWPDPSQKTAA